MNREQKAAAIAEIVDQIRESDAVFAVDFRGISVPQAADVRTRLRDADASFRVVKNTPTERAADADGAPRRRGRRRRAEAAARGADGPDVRARRRGAGGQGDRDVQPRDAAFD